MPPEWNTRSMVEVPELLVSGLLHEFGLADLARLDRIQPRRAFEHHLVIGRRETLTKVSGEWDDLGLCGRRQKNADCERR